MNQTLPLTVKGDKFRCEHLHGIQIWSQLWWVQPRLVLIRLLSGLLVSHKEHHYQGFHQDMGRAETAPSEVKSNWSVKAVVCFG